MKNFARSIEYTVRLKAASDEKSVLAESEFHIGKILQDKKILSDVTKVLRYVRNGEEKLRKMSSG